jgi:small subunit ribosomal protein S6
MPFYENVFIARQDVTAAQVEGLTEHFAGIVAAQGGNVTKREYWGLKSLSYRIRKNRKGHYVLMNIDAPAAAVTEMERNMRIHEDIIRHLTVRVDELEEGPSAMLQSKGRDRDDRGGRDGRRDRDDRPRGDRDDRLRPSRPRAEVAAATATAAEGENQ